MNVPCTCGYSIVSAVCDSPYSEANHAPECERRTVGQTIKTGPEVWLYRKFKTDGVQSLSELRDCVDRLIAEYGPDSYIKFQGKDYSVMVYVYPRVCES